jgi:hypothetical protein
MVCSPLSAAEVLLEVIPLKHTSSEELIPIITPLIHSDIVVTGKDQRLIVRTPPAQLVKIQSLITKLDVPRKKLLISIRQAERTNHRVGNINTHPSSRKPRLKAQQYSTKNLHSGIYQVHALEGYEALVSFEQSVPYEGQQYFSAGRRNAFGRTIKYRKVSNEFLVLPRLKGDVVELEITLRQQPLQKYQDKILQKTKLKTFIRGPVDHWIDLGTVNNRGIESAERHLRSRTIHSSPQEPIIQVKVELKQ